MASPSADPDAWLRLASSSSWSALVKKIDREAAAKGIWGRAGPRFGRLSAAVSLGGSLDCQICGSAFSPLQKLAAHRFRVHEIRHPASELARGSRCARCQTEFWSRPRLVEHLKYSLRGAGRPCLLLFWVQQIFHPARWEEVEVPAPEDRGAVGRFSVAHLPARRVAGPLPP